MRVRPSLSCWVCWLTSSALFLAAASPCAAQESAASAPAEGPGTMKLSLAEATSLAVRNNLALKAALIDEQIASTRVCQALAAFDPTAYGSLDAGKTESLFAGLFPDPVDPTVSHTVIVNNQDDVMNGALGMRGKLTTGATYDLTLGQGYRYLQGGGAINPLYTNTSRLILTQPLLRGAWESYQCAPVDLARNTVQQTRQVTRGATLAKIREVETAYFELVAARENKIVRERSLAVADQLVEINRVKVETGALPPIEMTSAESARAFRVSELVTADAEVLAAADHLRRQIFAFQSSADWTVVIEPTEDIDERIVEILPVDSIVSIAMRTEPHILRSRLEVEFAKRELEQRCSERKPRLDAVGSLEFTSLGDDGFATYADLFNRSSDAMSFSAGLVFEYPLGNRFASARVAEARLVVSRASVNLRNLEIEVNSQVRDAVRNLEVAARAIRARRDAVRLADQQVEVERAKFEVQASTNFEVFEVEDQRNQRRIELVRALIAHRLALLDLPRVTGAPLRELIVAGSESRPS
jgi:outer membrane protein